MVDHLYGYHLAGFKVVAQDGTIGVVDELTYEQTTGCLVVDIGFWVFAKKRMIPARSVGDVDWIDKRIWVAMTKEQIKQAPEYAGGRRAPDWERYGGEIADSYPAYGIAET